MLSRRDLLKLGLAGTPYILLPPGRAYGQSQPPLPPSPATTAFQAELPIPSPPVPVPNFYAPVAPPPAPFPPAEYREGHRCQYSVLRHCRGDALGQVSSRLRRNGNLGLPRSEPGSRGSICTRSHVQPETLRAEFQWHPAVRGPCDRAASQQPSREPCGLRHDPHDRASPRRASAAACGRLSGRPYQPACRFSCPCGQRPRSVRRSCVSAARPRLRNRHQRRGRACGQRRNTLDPVVSRPLPGVHRSQRVSRPGRDVPGFRPRGARHREVGARHRRRTDGF